MKIVNFVLGLAAAIILGALIILGIKAFYPEPSYPAYQNYPPYPASLSSPCATKDAQCLTQQKADQAKYDAQQADVQKQQQAYDDQMKVYNKNLFIIANVVGLVVFAVGFWLIFGAALASHGVPIGIMLAGLWSIIYGYGRGWESIDNRLKFFVGLVIAVIVIGGSMWLIQRRAASGKLLS